ncbi:UDP-N-acetylmuramate--L-alanine ligase [Candidatus Uhrbacteria bacterium]|nr:UDP-N-acetylmuramate--L-alanine ligase [Candidatus Uhrbacteria bacterium]
MDIFGKRIHIVGIKGAGVSALAKILRARGATLCGSDVDERFFTDRELHAEGIPVEPFSSAHVASDALDSLIYSTAWSDADEVRAAQERGIPVLSYPQALGEVFNESRCGIAIAGSHGKSTTSALVSHILKEAGHDLSAVIGSVMVQHETNAFVGSDPFFVIEADEYENKFAYYKPHALLITNIDYDHPDYFRDREAYDRVFEAFARGVFARKGVVVACGDDSGVRRVFSGDPVTFYGTSALCHYQISGIAIHKGRIQYTLFKRDHEIGTYTSALAGVHNALNICGAVALCDVLGIVDCDAAARHAATFMGVARRFEYRGMRGSVRVYDDFAHHPTEIVATLKGARDLFPGARIWCVFGAHTYTRTRELLPDFARSFVHADRALILDIYGSAREQGGAIHGRDLASAISSHSNNASYVGSHASALEAIESHIDEMDVLITMGAGDVWTIAESLLNHSRSIK